MSAAPQAYLAIINGFYEFAHLFGQLESSFPYATLVANVISCVILGILIGINIKGELASSYRLLLMTGFCGGFSTFSTFSGETYLLIQSGELGTAFANVMLSLIICIPCIFLGIKLAG